MAASTTKHVYEAAENSVTHRNAEKSNGKMHLAATSSATDTFDWTKKEAIKQQRKLRLTQVRRQSKEIASQVLEKVECEKQRQLDAVNEIKRNELLKWRQQQIAQTENDYKSCLHQVGGAHLAAERETEKMKQIDAQRMKNRKLALQRSKLAAEKVKAKNAANGKVRIKATQVHTVSTQVDSSLNADSDSDASSSSSASSVCSVIVRTNKKKISPKKLAPPDKKSMKSQAINYVAENFISINTSTSTDISLGMESPPIAKFTRVSDLLKKKTTAAACAPPAAAARIESQTTKPYVSKTFKLDKSGVQPPRSPPKKTALSTKSNSAKLTMQPIKRKPTMAKKPSLTKYEIKPYVPQFVKAKKPTAAQGTTETANSQQTVQFYDHSNRFTKEYESKLNLIENYDEPAPLNAMQEAELEREREQKYVHEMAMARQMEHGREQQAREKTKIRKDYDLMSTQLADLLKNEELAKKILHTNEVLSEKRLIEIEKERQKLMIADFQRMFNEPPSLITCPKLTNRAPDAVGLNVADRPTSTSRTANTDHSDLSAESCNSFLLEYVTSRTNNLANEIGKIRTDKTGDGHANLKKIDALTSLLSKVNGLRKTLTAEIDRNAANGNTNIDYILREMDRVKERQAEIMHDDASKMKLAEPKSDDNKENVNGSQLLSEREKILKMKESQLEKRTHELYLREKRLKNQKQLVAMNARDAKITQGAATKNANTLHADDAPVRIVINVNEDDAHVVSNVPKGQKWGEIIGTNIGLSDGAAKDTKLHTKSPVVNRTGRVYRKTPAKANNVKLDVDTSSPTTTLTAYLSPPEAVQTELTKRLLQKQPTTKQPTQPPLPLTTAQDLNPQLLHYIVRLLGMSRTSIEQLNVSSVSTVSTPNSSVVNVSQNRKMSFSSISSTSWPEAMPNIDDAKWEQLNKFIAENHKFVSNLNDTFSKTAPATKRDAKSAPVWNELLTTETTKAAKNDQPKSIMRKIPAKAIEAKADEPTKNDLITKYDELTANCAKRINDLDQMISKVREEKQKLLENTLSSAGSLVNGNTKENITEYMDFPHEQRPSIGKGDNDNGEATFPLQTSTKSADSSAGSDHKGTTAAPSPEFSSSSGAAIATIMNKTGLLTTRARQFGESKDSGVGVSRPVTSSDFRDSPELRPKQNEQMDKFVPLLNDIPRPKISYRISDMIQSELQLEQAKRSSESTKERATKLPPAALTRYSPHMDEEHVHELSTITEVDTPATSRLNATADLNAAELTTIDAAAVHELQQNRAAFKQLLYNQFPDFQEYAANAITDVTPSGSTILEDKLEKLLEISGQHTNEMKYKLFAATVNAEAPSTSLRDSIQTNFDYQQFPTHTEYAKDTPCLLDSQSINQFQLSSDGSNGSGHSHAPKDQTTDESSLPDIVNELKKRNILRESFEMESNEDQLNRQNASTAVNKTTFDSLSDTLEQELHGMGIGWASSMLKKTKQVSTVSSSSTTSSASANDSHMARRSHQKSKNQIASPPQKAASNPIDVDASENANDDKSTTLVTQTDADTTSKPINLKEFLARELMKHSSSSSSSSLSLSCSNSSLASIFLKSYLGNSSSIHSNTPDMPRQNNNEKQRTSTPVAGELSSGHRSLISFYKKSSSPQPPQLDHRSLPPHDESDANASTDLTGKLFSGESHLSSVRINNSDVSTSDTAAPSKTNTILQAAEHRTHDEFDALIGSTNVKLNAAGAGSSSTSSTS